MWSSRVTAKAVDLFPRVIHAASGDRRAPLESRKPLLGFLLIAELRIPLSGLFGGMMMSSPSAV
jgi:hypothetical protein